MECWIVFGFYVLDKNGNLKAKTGGPGASLPDPLTVPHGGTNLITVPAHGILYSDAINSYNIRIPDTDNGVAVPKALSNLLFPGETPATNPLLGLVPRWTAIKYILGQFSVLLKPADFYSQGTKSFIAYRTAGGTFQITYPANTTLSESTFVDATTTWSRFSGGAAGVAAGFASNLTHQLQHLPVLATRLRLSGDITGQDIWVMLDTQALAGSAFNVNAVTGIGFRYSTVAGDTGWVPFYSTGSAATFFTALGTAAINTEYTLQITPGVGIYDFNFSVIQGGVTSAVNISVPSAIFTANLLTSISIANTSGAGTKTFDMSMIQTLSSQRIAA